jgi:hypothetical protein
MGYTFVVTVYCTCITIHFITSPSAAVGSTFISFACGIECTIWFIASLSPSPAVGSTFIRFASGTDVAIWFNTSGTTAVGYALVSFAFGIFIAIRLNTSSRFPTFNFNTIFFLHSSL